MQFQLGQGQTNSGKKPNSCKALFGSGNLDAFARNPAKTAINLFEGAQINKGQGWSQSKSAFVYSDSTAHTSSCGGNMMDVETPSPQISEDSQSHRRISPFSTQRCEISEDLITPKQEEANCRGLAANQERLLPLTKNGHNDNGMVETIHRKVLIHILEAEGKERHKTRTEHMLGSMDVEAEAGCELTSLETLSPFSTGFTMFEQKQTTPMTMDAEFNLGRGHSMGTNSLNSDLSLHRNLSLNLDNEDELNADSKKWIKNHPAPSHYLKSFNQELLIVDCRFGFEYLEGHIRGAVNLNKPSMIDFLFTKNSSQMSNRGFLHALKSLSGSLVTIEMLKELVTRFPNPESNCSPLVIFHCEFSICRAPEMWKFLRTQDRSNVQNYPNLTYPQIYLLKEGYSKFYKDRSDLCAPHSRYVPMNDAEYEREKESETRSLADDWAKVDGGKGKSSKRSRLRF